MGGKRKIPPSISFKKSETGIPEKIFQVMKEQNIPAWKLADKLFISVQSLDTKFRKDCFSLGDLSKLYKAGILEPGK